MTARASRATALVESPLQLLGAVEAHAAGLGGRRTQVRVRDGLATLASAARSVQRTTLPPGLELTSSPSGWSGRPWVPPREEQWLVGDAFSGRFQAGLVTSPPAAGVVLLDDGLATLELVRVIVEGEPALRVGHAHGRGTAVRARLGAATTARLRRLAATDQLVLLTAMPVPAELAAGWHALGARLVTHRFAWLAAQPAPQAPHEPTVVVGSALVTDGWLQPEPYLRWVRSFTRHGPVRYVPHRRSDPRVLTALRATPSVRVEPPGPPVEMLLRGLRPPQRVVCLPSTAYVLLDALHAGTGVRVTADRVPDDWWTPQASPEVRRYLSSVLDLVDRPALAPVAVER